MRTAFIAFIVCLCALPGHCASVWDLAGDWSDTTNPNGVWSYNLAPGVPLTTHWDDWDAVNISYSADQPAWALEPVQGPQHVPAWLKSLGVALDGYDLPAGRVAVHGAETERTGSDLAGVTWTSPINGQISLNGGTWLGRKTLGRSMNWRLSLNGASLTGGSLTSADTFTSSTPFNLNGGSGGPAALSFPVAIGDVLNFEVFRPSAGLPAEYVGIDLQIAAQQTASAGVYWHDESLGVIRHAASDGSSQQTVVTTGTPGTGIDVDTLHGKVYWTNTGDDKIQRANVDGTGVEDIIVAGLETPLGLAVDAVNNKMYWTDQGRNKISRANLDGTGRELLVSAGTVHPYSIDLDLSAGKMYWTDSLTNKVQRANLDGTGLEDLISLGNIPAFPSPRGLAVDPINDKIYVASQGEGAIKRMNLDGTGLETLIAVAGWNGPEDIALDLANGKMYWTGLGSITKIQRANLDGSNVEDLVTSGLGLPRGIAFVAAVPEPASWLILVTGLFVAAAARLRRWTLEK